MIGERDSIESMRRFSILLFAFVLAFNAVSLSAYAFSCDMSSSVEMSEMDCHEKMADQQNHCDGVCFCQHVMLGQQALAYDSIETPVVFEKHVYLKQKFDIFTSNMTFPPFRPPILAS